jgi:hypothetical protein
MFSNIPATPPKLCSKWCASLKGFAMVCRNQYYASGTLENGCPTFKTFSYSFECALCIFSVAPT